MKTILMLLLACVTAGAQECPKYQHLEYVSSQDPVYAVYHSSVPTCVDDLHVVTEKEWQDLQEQIKSLEALNSLQLQPAQEIPELSCYLTPDKLRVDHCIDTFPQPSPEQPQQTAMIEDDWSNYVVSVRACHVHEAYDPETGKCVKP